MISASRFPVFFAFLCAFGSRALKLPGDRMPNPWQ